MFAGLLCHERPAISLSQIICMAALHCPLQCFMVLQSTEAPGAGSQRVGGRYRPARRAAAGSRVGLPDRSAFADGSSGGGAGVGAAWRGPRHLRLLGGPQRQDLRHGAPVWPGGRVGAAAGTEGCWYATHAQVVRLGLAHAATGCRRASDGCDLCCLDCEVCALPVSGNAGVRSSHRERALLASLS